MVNPSYGFWEKVIWFCVHVCLISLLLVFLSDAWTVFASQYFATTLYDPLYPIAKVPFPAVSICSNNRISRQAAEKYAIELSDADPERRRPEYFMEQIAYLGLLYTNDFAIDPPDLFEFQHFLDLYNTADDERYFNTLRKMAVLTPPCGEVIMKCLLGGKEVQCFSKRTFQTTLTSYGYCCTFNHNDIYRSRKQNYRFAQPGLGLTVFLNTTSNDTHFPLLRIDGTVVIIHAAYKFPDISSGGSSENFITNGRDNSLSVTPQVFDSVPSVRQFDPETRNCYFKDETPDEYVLGRLKYSFNNCVTRCRIKSILVLCSCLPFTMPFELAPNGTKTVYCTLRHLECLQRYRFKWKSVLTQKSNIPDGLERETEDALYCPQCLPSCDDVIYKVTSSKLPLDFSSIDDLPSQSKNDVTIVRVFFSKPHTYLYRKIVTNSWFEAFSTIGNYCGIIIGFSLIIFCEVAYFLIQQISQIIRLGVRKEGRSLIIYP